MADRYEQEGCRSTTEQVRDSDAGIFVIGVMLRKHWGHYPILLYLMTKSWIVIGRLVDVLYIRDSQWIFPCHALLLFADRSLCGPVSQCMAERIIAADWLILRQAMYGACVLWPQKYAHGKKYAMIVLSGHFKTLIFYKIFDVLSSKSYGDHRRSLYIITFPFDRVLSPRGGGGGYSWYYMMGGGVPLDLQIHGFIESKIKNLKGILREFSPYFYRRVCHI